MRRIIVRGSQACPSVWLSLIAAAITIGIGSGIVFAADATANPGAAVKAGEKAQTPTPSGPVYVLTSPADQSLLSRPQTGDNGKELDRRARAIIQIVDRAKVDTSLFVDSSGIRMYADSDACRRTFAELPQDSETSITLAWLVRDLLGRRYGEAGVDPEMIPVNNSIAKTCGNDGMVLIKGAEFERSGHYFTSQSTKLAERTGDRYRVKVPDFYIDKYKVTNAEYCRFLNADNPGYWNWSSWNQAITRNADGRFVVAKGQEKRPVVGVNWYQARGYTQWMGRRLPTEAEWEFAAGGKEGRRFPWGNEPPDETRGHFVGKEYAAVDAHPAGATPEGIFDLAGNAAEWCADYYDDAYYETAPEDGLLKNPTGPKQGLAKWQYRRMFKGFCPVTDTPEFLHGTKRHARPPLLASAIGFRSAKPGCT